MFLTVPETILGKQEYCLCIGSLLVRPFILDDDTALSEGVRKSYEVLKNRFKWATKDYSKTSARDFIYLAYEYWHKNKEFHFGIFDAETEKFIGSIALHHVDQVHDNASLGYWICTEFSRKGIISLVAKEFAKFSFKKFKLNRIEIITAIDNIASQKTALKIGAKYEGCLRNKFCFTSGNCTDAYMYSILPSDLI